MHPTKALKGYLHHNQLSHAAFGRLIGAAQPTVWHWLAGLAFPSDRFALKIQSATGIRAERWHKAKLDAARNA